MINPVQQRFEELVSVYHAIELLGIAYNQALDVQKPLILMAIQEQANTISCVMAELADAIEQSTSQ
jgi:hypothetical protein